jgi:hypothetical protein
MPDDVTDDGLAADLFERGFALAGQEIESIGAARAASALAMGAAVAAVALSAAYRQDLEEVLDDVCRLLRRSTALVDVATLAADQEGVDC